MHRASLASPQGGAASVAIAPMASGQSQHVRLQGLLVRRRRLSPVTNTRTGHRHEGTGPAFRQPQNFAGLHPRATLAHRSPFF